MATARKTKNTQTKQSIAQLISEVLQPRDDIASAEAAWATVHVRTQAGERFDIDVSVAREP
jgi:hypothetical protein